MHDLRRSAARISVVPGYLRKSMRLDIAALRDRGVREDQTLDYKQELGRRRDVYAGFGGEAMRRGGWRAAAPCCLRLLVIIGFLQPNTLT